MLELSSTYERQAIAIDGSYTVAVSFCSASASVNAFNISARSSFRAIFHGGGNASNIVAVPVVLLPMPPPPQPYISYPDSSVDCAHQ
jgi:hypothetical protein